MSQIPVNIVYPIDGGSYPIVDPDCKVRSAYFTASFGTTCGGGPHNVKWGFDGNSIAGAEFYDQFSAQFTWKLPAGIHTFHALTNEQRSRGSFAQKSRCHGLVPWSITLVATPVVALHKSRDATGLSRGVSRWSLHRWSQAVRLDATALGRGGSRSQLNSSKRETPRGKPVASGDFGLIRFSRKRETPRDKPVASFGLFVQSTSE